MVIIQMHAAWTEENEKFLKASIDYNSHINKSYFKWRYSALNLIKKIILIISEPT